MMMEDEPNVALASTIGWHCAKANSVDDAAAMEAATEAAVSDGAHSPEPPSRAPALPSTQTQEYYMVTTSRHCRR